MCLSTPAIGEGEDGALPQLGSAWKVCGLLPTRRRRGATNVYHLADLLITRRFVARLWWQSESCQTLRFNRLSVYEVHVLKLIGSGFTAFGSIFTACLFCAAYVFRYARAQVICHTIRARMLRTGCTPLSGFTSKSFSLSGEGYSLTTARRKKTVKFSKLGEKGVTTRPLPHLRLLSFLIEGRD